MALGAGRFAGFVALGSEAFFGFSLVVVLEVFNAESVLREEPLNLVESALQVKDSFAGLRHLALQAFLFVRGKARLAELRGGGILLVLGVQARWVALALVPILAGATWAHWGNGWMFGFPNGGWEYPLYLTLLAIAQFMLGDGAYALVRSKSLECIAL